MFFSRLIRTLFYSLVGVVLLLLLLALASQTGFFRDLVLTRIVAIADARLNGSLAIERLSGNLVSSLQLDNVVLQMEGETIAIVQRMRAEYNPLGLLTGEIHVQKIALVAPRVWLHYDSDGGWNIARLVKADSLEPQNGAAAGQASAWQVAMPRIDVSSGSACLDSTTARELGIPRRLQGLDVRLGLWLYDNRSRIALEQLNFETEGPDLKVRTARADLALERQNLRATNVEFDTERSKLTSKLDVHNINLPFIDMRVSAAPLSLDEVRRMRPEVILYGEPRIDLEARGPLDALVLKAGIRWGQGIINLNGQISLKKTPISYDLDCGFAHLNLQDMTRDSTLASDLNFSLRATGSGVDLGEMVASGRVSVDSSTLAGLTVDNATLQGSYQPDSLEFDLQAVAEGVEIGLRANASATALNIPDSLVYHADAKISHLDLARFSNDTTKRSDLNLSLEVAGSGSSLKTLAADFELKALPSVIAGMKIDSSRSVFRIENETVEIEHFRLRSPFGDAAVNGKLAFSGKSQLDIELDRLNFSALGLLAGIDSLAGGGKITSEISGLPDSLSLQGNANLSGMSYPGFTLSEGSVVASGHIAHSGVQFEVEAGLLDLVAAGQPLDSCAFRIDYLDSLANYQISTRHGDDFSLNANGRVELHADAYSLVSHQLDVGFWQQNWMQSGDNAILRVAGDRYQLSRLTLVAGGQELLLQGVISPRNQNDFNLQLSGLDIVGFRRLLSLDDDYVLRGKLDLGLHLTRRLATPSISGDFRLASGEYSGIAFDELRGGFGYADGEARWQLAIAKTRQDSLFKASARFPMQFSLAPYKQTFPRDGEVEFNMGTRGIEIAFLQPFVAELRDVRGMLEADLAIKNTLRDLRGSGSIQLVDGGFRLPELGTHYKNINLEVQLDDKTLRISDFSMHSGGGYARALEGSLALSEDHLENFKSKVKLKNFQLVNNKKMKARASGEIEFSGSLRAPEFQGELTIDESRIFYQQLEEETAVALTSQPFFVIASDSTVFDSSGALRFQKTAEIKENEFLESEFYKNLTGELSIEFPRNAWVRSTDASIEIEGDVAALKPRGSKFAIFGSFSTLRGFYELLGNRFQVDRGEMVFNGEPEINPEVAIAATTTIVEGAEGLSPEKREFSVQVGGTLLFPEFTFTLDGDVASQEDIVSILLFGQTSQDLVGNLPGAGSETNESNSRINERAKGLLAGQLLKQLSGRLGQQLSLDVIQIESGGSFADSKVRVGKYIAPEVFVSWSQDFGAEGNQLVELEYEIPLSLRFLKLLLQASSDRQGETGLDVIWKFEW